MPSPFPRLAIVVTPEQHRLLSRLSALQGRSQASYVRHLLDLATPSLRALLTPLERAEAEQEALDEGFQCWLEEGLREAEEDLEQQLEFFDPLGIEEALETAEAGSADERPQGAEPAAPEAPTPRIVIRGSETLSTGGASIVRLQRRGS